MRTQHRNDQASALDAGLAALRHKTNKRSLDGQADVLFSDDVTASFRLNVARIRNYANRRWVLSEMGKCELCEGSAIVQSAKGEYGAHGVNCEVCGTYWIEDYALEGFEQQRHLLAGLIKRSSTELTLTRENVPQLLTGSGLPASFLDQLDITLEYAKEHQQRGDQFVDYADYVKTDYPYAFARDAQAFLHFFQTLSTQRFLEESPGRDSARRTEFRITPEGWQRLRELAKTGRDLNRAFVAMWFDPKLNSAWLQGINPALEALLYVPVRIDLTDSDDKIDDRIVAEIRRSSLLVADFTGHRGGVYFEAGFALGLGIPVVWTCRNDDY